MREKERLGGGGGVAVEKYRIVYCDIKCWMYIIIYLCHWIKSFFCLSFLGCDLGRFFFFRADAVLAILWSKSYLIINTVNN